MSNKNYRPYLAHKFYLSEAKKSSTTSVFSSDTSQFLKHTPEELLSCKKGKTKSSEAHRLCQSLLRDAAVYAKIWNSAPLLSEIEPVKQEKFFSYIAAYAPHIAGRRNELRVRLGRMLQNRRKYLNDIEIGKRRKPLTHSVSNLNSSYISDVSTVKTEIVSDANSLENINHFGNQIVPRLSSQIIHVSSHKHTSNSHRYWHESAKSSHQTFSVTMAEAETYEESVSDGTHHETVKKEDGEVSDETSDYEWQPPSEAEMKLIRARRDRSDKISKLMGDYLLKGYKMLSTLCECGTILLQDRNGAMYCIACNELDSDVDKDDPLTNEAAALAQVRERELGLLREDGASPMSSASDSPQEPAPKPPTSASSDQRPPTIQHFQTTPITTASLTASVPQRPINNYTRLCNGIECNTNASLSQSVTNHNDAVDTLNKKLNWATNELDKTMSVEYSIQLCNLIKSCANAIQSLKAL